MKSNTLDRAGIVLLLIVLPALAIGGIVGWQLYGRIEERRFRQLISLLLLISGLTLVL